MFEYSIIVDNGQSLPRHIGLTSGSDKGAIMRLKSWLKSNAIGSDTNVFLAFTNRQQGFTGYINPNGKSSATGKSWV